MMEPFQALAIGGMVAYAVIFILGIVLVVLAARLLLGLIRLVCTLNDYWRMRTAEQFQARGGKSHD